MFLSSVVLSLMKTTKTKPFILVGIVLWLVGVILASLYDLDITLKVADKNSLYGIVLEVLGEIPAILFTSFNLALMAVYFFECTELRAKDKALAVTCLVGCIGTSVFATVKTAKYIAEYRAFPLHLLTVIFAVAAALAIAVLFIMAAIFMGGDKLKKYFYTATRCTLAALLTFAVIWTLKLLWGRVRPRQLGLGGGLLAFTPWYLPQGFNGYFSFPSGHTANAAVIFSVIYYFRFLGKKAKKFVPFFFAALCVWIAAVAFSRVVVGAHYLSDVLFGAAITFAIVYFVRPREDDRNVH